MLIRNRLLSILFYAVLFFLFSLALRAQAADLSGKVSDAQIDHMLTENWSRYKATFIQTDGRVIDYNGNVTTSEGQAYAMLRAFWMRDRATFDTVYRWTRDNLQIPRGDHLFSWKWGEKPDHSWGALDRTSAADADQDIALALLLAGQVWREPSQQVKSQLDYHNDARLILNDIWDRLTLDAPLGRVLLPGDWPRPPGKTGANAHTYAINLSYFAPYAYRAFAEADPDHDWTLLIDSSYEILSRAIAQTDTHLPPDWVEISLDNDQVALYREPLDSRGDFGYEAIRVYWRVALDALLSPLEKRAAGLLATRTLLPRYWIIRQDLPVSLTWDGIVRNPKLESGAVYGAILPALTHQDRHVTEEVVTRRLLPNLQPGGVWNTKNDYYAQNWLWFGLALHRIERDPPDFVRGSALSRLANLLKVQTRGQAVSQSREAAP
jgi:endo-1,4-beta-D-glucanase Y